MRKKRQISLIKSVKLDIGTSTQMRLPGWAYLPMFIGALVCGIVLDHFGRFELAGPLLNCVLVLGFMIVLKRRLWRHAWFWITMAVVAALHVPLILYIPWTKDWIPALAFAGIDSLDIFLLIGIFDALERFMGNGQQLEDVNENS